MLEIELRSCPFCGGKARLAHNCMTDYGDSYWVECEECLAETYEEPNEKIVINKWNKRVDKERKGE